MNDLIYELIRSINDKPSNAESSGEEKGRLKEDLSTIFDFESVIKCTKPDLKVGFLDIGELFHEDNDSHERNRNIYEAEDKT